jgi:hypothetical protein
MHLANKSTQNIFKTLVRTLLKLSDDPSFCKRAINTDK